MEERRNAHKCLILKRTDYNPCREKNNKMGSKICKKCRETYINKVICDSYSKRKQLCIGEFTFEVVKRVIERIFGKNILYDYEIEKTLWNCLSEIKPTY